MATNSPELFVGPRPYEEKDARLFFGREREARDLFSLVIANPLLLIYAPSGAGKTSLINARLVPMLGKVKDPVLVPFLGEGKGFNVLPIARVSGLIPDGLDLDATPGANIFVFNTLVSWMKRDGVSQAAERKLAEQSLAQKRLADYLNETQPITPFDPVDEDNPPPPRVVIFDQFEELFTSHFERWQDREGFFEQVNDALRGGPFFLRPRDIRQPETLFRRLAAPGDPISQFLSQSFSSPAREILDRFDGSHVSEASLKTIIEELNTLIRGESLYTSQRFAGFKLEKETLEWSQVVRKSKNFTDLNRLLLEAAYPSEIYRRTQGDRGLRVVFSMREDYIAELDPYIHLLSDRLGTRYRLERLRRDAALAAVTSPMQYTHLRFSEGVADQLVENLLKTPVKTAGGEMQEVVGEFVETVQLQVVCQTLLNKLSGSATEITKEDLKAYGNIDKALQVFYEDSIRKSVERSKEVVPPNGESGVKEGFLRAWFEEKLITPAETRGLAYRGATHTEGLINEAVDVLDRVHIIREERRGEGRWYELSHDRFIYPIKESNRNWLLQYSSAVTTRDSLKERANRWTQSQRDEELLTESEVVVAQSWMESPEAAELGLPAGLRQLFNASRAYIRAQEASRQLELTNAQKVAEAERLRAEEQQRRAEEQTHAASRLRRVVAALAVVMLLALAATAFAMVQRAQARTAELEAVKQSSLADARAKEAELEKTRANQQEQRASQKQAEAESARTAEATQARVAEGERQRANERALAAEIALRNQKIAQGRARESELDREAMEELVIEYSKSSQGSGSVLTREQLRRKIRELRSGVSGASAARGRDLTGLGKLWAPGSTLRIRFLGGTPSQQAAVERYAPEWTRYANIKFAFSSDPNSEVRIAFRPDDGSWSYVGTDILGIPKGEPTMNLGFVTADSENEADKMSILHEFGHVLGLLHEFNNPTADIPWNKEAVYKRYTESPNNWEKEHVDLNIFAKWQSRDLPAKEFDPLSIMMFPFEKELMTNGIALPENHELSAKDKEYIARLYPRG